MAPSATAPANTITVLILIVRLSLHIGWVILSSLTLLSQCGDARWCRNVNCSCKGGYYLGNTIELAVDDRAIDGYLALPESGEGPGVLVLHAWWGLTPFFRSACDRLAAEGFVALAPDLHHGSTADTIEQAEELVSKLSPNESEQDMNAAVEYLQTHPAVSNGSLGTVGFSMGAFSALRLSDIRPDAITAVVLFYGAGEADFTNARAAYLGHFAEHDEWEPTEGVQEMERSMRAAGREVTIYTYSGTGHWFFENDRPEHYNAEAANLAWSRSVEFLQNHLGSA